MEVINLTDEAVDIARAWDRLHEAMDDEIIAHMTFDGNAWLVMAIEDGENIKKEFVKEGTIARSYEPTLAGALNVMAAEFEARNAAWAERDVEHTARIERGSRGNSDGN